MRRWIAAIGGAAFGTLLIVGTVAAADPTAAPSPTATQRGGTVATVLGLNQAEIHDLRQDGLSLAQIAAKQAVDVQKVIDALAARWIERIDVRVANGALTADEAAALKTEAQTTASEMVSATAPGGMQGAAVGAGPQNGAGAGNGSGVRARDGSGMRARDGSGAGDGTCDGSGPHGPARP